MDPVLPGPPLKKGQRQIDFSQFEIALELVAEKIGMSHHEVRSAIIDQGKPKQHAATRGRAILKLV